MLISTVLIGCTTTDPVLGFIAQERSERLKSEALELRPTDIDGAWKTIIIRVPNDNGSHILITLKNGKDAFIGPSGERYSILPSIKQLQTMYGRVNGNYKIESP
jgi:hypothetical protein